MNFLILEFTFKFTTKSAIFSLEKQLQSEEVGYFNSEYEKKKKIFKSYQR